MNLEGQVGVKYILAKLPNTFLRSKAQFWACYLEFGLWTLWILFMLCIDRVIMMSIMKIHQDMHQL